MLGTEEHSHVEDDEVVEPVEAEIEGVRLRLHARNLRGSMTLVEVERPQAEVPMYAAALAAIAEGRLPATGPQRRTVRRLRNLDVIALGEESTFAPSEPLPRRRRRSPAGTVHQ